MKLLFDLTKTQPISDIKYHGGGIYGEMILKSLLESTHDIGCFYDSKRWINPSVIELLKKCNVVLYDSNNISINEAANRCGKLIYSPLVGNTSKLVDSDVTYIATLHGVRDLEYPYDNYQRLYYYNWKRYKLFNLYYQYKAKKQYVKIMKNIKENISKENVKLITVSYHSSFSLLSFFPFLKENDLQVFYSPSTISFTDNISDYSKEKYYLLVSANRWIKNSLRAIEALDELFVERPELQGKVIITGINKPEVFIRRIINKDRFEFIKYVDRDSLLSLYKDAYLFIYPTLNEGFGYPPLEAMSLGTPVIGSSISSVPEICGDAILYFNPLMKKEIKARILQVENKKIREELIKKGLNRANYIKLKQDRDLKRMTDYILSYIKQ